MEAYYWSLFKIKHCSCLTNYVKLFFHLANLIEIFYSNVLLFLSRPSWVPQHLDLQLNLLAGPACLPTEPQTLEPREAKPRKGGAGVHLTIFVSFFMLVSLLCSLKLLKTQLILPTLPQRQPSFCTWASCCLSTPFVPLRVPPPQLTPHISALIFLFSVYHKQNSQGNFTNAWRFSGELPTCCGGEKVKHTILTARFEAAKWPWMSKQESDCWTWSDQAEETPAKSKTRSPVSPLYLGLQQPAPQT